MTQPSESQAPETLEVDSVRVACDGGTLGHPRVYLDLTAEGHIDCPYCGRRFVLKVGAKTGH